MPQGGGILPRPEKLGGVTAWLCLQLEGLGQDLPQSGAAREPPAPIGGVCRLKKGAALAAAVATVGLAYALRLCLGAV